MLQWSSSAAATPCALAPLSTPSPHRMKSGQKSIYYMAADSVEAARAAPFVEALVARGTEVLYLTEPIDEACVTNLAKFADFELVDVSKEGVTVDEDGGCWRGGGTHKTMCVCWGGGRVGACMFLLRAGRRRDQRCTEWWRLPTHGRGRGW